MPRLPSGQVREWKDAHPAQAYAGRDRERAAALEAAERFNARPRGRVHEQTCEWRERQERFRREQAAKFGEGAI